MRIFKAIPLLSLLFAVPAEAQVVDYARRDTHERFEAFDIGVRTTVVPNAAYDAYSTNDALTQATLGLSHTGGVSGPWALALGLRWDLGASTARSRGADASLLVHRITVPFEGRFHAKPWLYAFARIAPGFIWQRAKVDDPSMPEGMRSTSWNFATDLSLGASLLFGSFDDSPTSHAPRFWLTPEVGYAWSAGGTSGLGPNIDADDPRRFGTLELQKVAIRGAFVRVAVTTTF
ncbi:MAG: hypothetical protein ACXWUG_32150 [Polyangiales bacterium]